MDEKKFNNIHDRFFKHIFSNRSNTVDFIKGILPSEILKQMDFRKVKLENQSFIDEELKQHFSDIVYTCPTKSGNLCITILFEHKSYPVKNIQIQLLTYMTNIWRNNLKQNVGITPIIPILFYHGRNKWKYRRFEELFHNLPHFLKLFLPDFDYILVDLNQMTDEEIQKEKFRKVPLIMAVSVMKHIFNDKDFHNILKNLYVKKLSFFTQRNAIEFNKQLLYYILTARGSDHDNLLKITEPLPGPIKELTMTTYDQIKLYSKLETIDKMLEEGLEWKVIKKVSGITQRQYNKYKSDSKLMAWAEFKLI